MGITGLRVALERGLIQSQGKTPEATMASALYTDVKRKAEKSAFTRCALLLGGQQLNRRRGSHVAGRVAGKPDWRARVTSKG